MEDVIRRHGLLMVGFALQLSLSLVLLWDPFATVSVGGAAVGELEGGGQLIRSFVMPATLALVIILLGSSQGSRRLWVAIFSMGALFASLGLLSVALATTATTEMIGAFSLLVGMAFGGMFALFFAYLTSVPKQEFIPVVLISSALSGLVTLLLEGPWAFEALVFLCLALSALLPIMMKRYGNVFMFLESSISRNVRGAAGYALRPLICFSLCALVAGLMRTQGFGDAEDMMFADMATKVLCPVGAMLLTVFSRQLARPSLLERLYDVLFPVTVTLYLLLPLLGPHYGMVLMVVDMLAFFLLSPLFVITSRNVATRYGLRAFTVCGAFACSFYGAAALGSALGLLIAPRGSYNVVLFLSVALIAVWLLAMVGHLLARGRSDVASELPSNPFEERFNELQHKYGLSPREREVAELVVRGRSVKVISETLYVSRSTVQSHMKALYRKLDIHSKQELINMVEGSLTDNLRN